MWIFVYFVGGWQLWWEHIQYSVPMPHSDDLGQFLVWMKMTTVMVFAKQQHQKKTWQLQQFVIIIN